ncbi:hypothetical protein M422DRAFT_158771 [Sphaerobolus stellatus SS14]|nr:hypothetical protein M422DRAFT_158771 [Sphaerobolus stellatus SS14]
MDTLSRREEEALYKATKARALKECDDYVKDCTTGRTISVAWACRGQYRDLQNCILQYTNPENMEILKAEYVRLRDSSKANPS